MTLYLENYWENNSVLQPFLPMGLGKCCIMATASPIKGAPAPLHKEEALDNTLIKAEHISLVDAQHLILDDVSLNIETKDFVTIVGPNGAGKSSLLKCLMGFYPPNRGSVYRKSGLRVGYIPQNLHANPIIPMLVKHFINLYKKVESTMMQSVCEEMGISNILDKSLHAISSGQLQRVLLARALLNEPELLVLDEPEQSLDVSGQLSLFKLLESIYEHHNLSVLMVSHDLHLVMSCTKRVVGLSQHICCSGEPQAVAKDPNFIALFGDDVAQQVAVYHHSHEGKHKHG